MKPSSQKNYALEYAESRILISSHNARTADPPRILAKSFNSIMVSDSVLNELGTAVGGMHNMRIKVVSLQVGNRKNHSLNIMSNVGLKGWEAKAVGSLLRKSTSTINFHYQYSFEDLIMNGMGHRFRLVKEF